jgi:hypothetical protein
MQDPHVEAVYYEIESAEGLPFGNPPSLTVSNHLGVFEVSNGRLTVRPAEHYASGEEARKVIDPFLRAWEVDSDLSRGIGAIRFKFHSVSKIDRRPPATGEGSVSVATGTGEFTVTGYAPTIQIRQNTYPPPPRDFRTTPEVEVAYGRWKAFREGREPLQSMAYAVLTLVESVAGGRRQAASTFKVEFRILATIGRLSSTKGDAASIRKFGQGMQFSPLSGGESSWLEAAVRQLIRRIGEHAAGPQLSRLTMRDLPDL